MVTFSGSMVSATGADIVTSALREVNLASAVEIPSAEDMAFGMEKLQRVIDQFNAIREMIFSNTFSTFNLLPNHSPHTIGPTGDFNTGDYRPVGISSAAFLLNSGAQTVDLPVRIRDVDWWAANPLKGMASSIVTDVYYDPALPNGNLNFFPICTGGNVVRLNFWNSLQQAVSQNTVLAFAQGYWEAVILTLAVSILPAFPTISPHPVLIARQAEAKKIIFANNDGPPRIDTASGMPGSGGSGRPDFNFLTGMRE